MFVINSMGSRMLTRGRLELGCHFNVYYSCSRHHHCGYYVVLPLKQENSLQEVCGSVWGRIVGLIFPTY